MERHVQVPTEDDRVTPNELLVYSAIKRWEFAENGYAYPSVETIQKHTGLGRMSISKAIQRLLDLGYFSKVEKRKNNSSIYYFSKYKKFEIFSYEFLDMDAPNYVKAYILASQKLMYKDPNTHTGTISYSDSEQGKLINMNRKMIAKANNWLEEREILSKLPTRVRDAETGLFKQARFYNLDKLQQAVVFQTIKNTEDIKKNTEDIETLKKQNEDLLKRMELLERQNKELLREQRTTDIIL